MTEREPVMALWDLETLRVITSLKAQVELARKGVLLENGELACFRLAIGMTNFFHVLLMIREKMHWNLFASEKHIADLENSVMNNDLGELTAHFCIIQSFFEYLVPETGHPQREGPWLFRRCTTFDEIASLRSQLEGPLLPGRVTPYVRRAILISMKEAIGKCFRQPKLRRRWEGLLLLYEASKYTYEQYEWFRFLNQLLRFSTDPIPGAAATLFLSFLSNTIFHGEVIQCGYDYSVEKETILCLLKLGASPMVCTSNHEILYQKVKDGDEKKTRPSWLQFVDLDFESVEHQPSALNKILTREWDPHFLKLLSQYTCCSLDATDICKSHFNVNEVPRLKCLASRNLRVSDFSKLDTPAERFIAFRHQPCSLSEHMGRPVTG